jgi:thiosulfate/3-mercaptopyruvate sulfurtransferase
MNAIVLALSLVIPAADTKEPPAYPRAELLIEAEALQKPGALAGVIIVDARPQKIYDESYIPGAVWFDTSAPGEKIDPARLAKLGIATDSSVVIYDDGNAKDAARLWWRLKYSGQERVALLNGGVVAWQAAGGKLTNEAKETKAIERQERQTNKRLATRDDVLTILKDKSAQIIDARSEKEYCGESKLAKRAGAIPGAVNLEWCDLIDAKSKKFKSADELSKIFKDAGIALDKPLVTYCQSGGRASVMAFGLELMGAKDVRNYYKSWSEWGNDPDVPIETPKGKN